MRQIEKEMNRAFFNGYDFHKSNTDVDINATVWDRKLNQWTKFAAVVRLHGNLIAAKDYDGNLWFSCAGWSSATTRSRLQALGAPARIKNFQMINTETGEPFPCALTKMYSN